MKRLLGLALLMSIIFSVKSQNILTLDNCRSLAIDNNKELKIAQEKIKEAYYERKAAYTTYLPELSATGAYLRNQKEFSLLSKDLKHDLTNVGTGLQNGVTDLITANPSLAANPIFQQLVGVLGPLDIPGQLNGLGQRVVDAFRTDTRNVYAGALTLTQPLYMGGKIRAYNKITQYSEELAKNQENTQFQEVILNTDQAYWLVVSLVNKKKLAESFVNLLRKLDSDMDKLIAEGIGTRAEGLAIKVQLNEAEIDLTRAEDGLTLAKMLLCQLCGLDLYSPITLADENLDNIPLPSMASETIAADLAVYNRPEIRSLELATDIYDQKVNVVRADYLPSLALLGNYVVTNPSGFNSFENKFKGMWSVGVLLRVPIWHWGQGSYKVKAAKTESRVAQYKLEDTKEKIELQINQAVFQVNEAAKKLAMTYTNMEKANENLRAATLGFEEGVIPSNIVLSAHTAWLSAQSDKIDSQIEVRLTDVYLKKALGILDQYSY